MLDLLYDLVEEVLVWRRSAAARRFLLLLACSLAAVGFGLRFALDRPTAGHALVLAGLLVLVAVALRQAVPGPRDRGR